MVWTEIGALIGMPILRSVVGWAGHALEDKKVTKFEWKQLFSTVLRIGLMGFVTYLGLNFAGVDNAAVIGAAVAFIADKLFGAIKK